MRLSLTQGPYGKDVWSLWPVSQVTSVLLSKVLTVLGGCADVVYLGWHPQIIVGVLGFQQGVAYPR